MTTRIALITGSSEGIGFAIAQRLAAHDIPTIVTARSLDRAEAAAKRISGAVAMSLDVCSDDSVAAVASSIAERWGRLDILVNNAGVNIDDSQTPSGADLSVVYRTFETNFFGAWRMSIAAPSSCERITTDASSMYRAALVP